MKKIDLLIFIEHLARELDVAVILKHYLERDHGLSVEIASMFRILEAQQDYLPRFVAIPFCYYPPPTLPRWNRAGHFNLAWEQLFFSSFQHEKRPRGPVAIEHIRHHAWGAFHRDFLLAHGVPAAHIFVNGHPAHQLYREPYRQGFLSRQQLVQRYQLDPEKKWVLFAENYAWAFYSDYRINELVREGLSREVADSLRGFSLRSFQSAMRWLHQLSQESDVQVILRPRPALSLEAYQRAIEDALGGEPGFRLIKDETVREWILASDVVLSSYSTTLLEAAVAAKPAFSVQPEPLPGPLHMAWMDEVEVLSNPQQLLEVCKNADIASNARLQRWAAQNLLAEHDPILKLSEFLADCCRNHPQGWGVIPTELLERRDLKQSPLRRLKNLIHQGLGALTGKKTTWRASEDYLRSVDSLLEPTDVAERQKKWALLLNR